MSSSLLRMQIEFSFVLDFHFWNGYFDFMHKCIPLPYEKQENDNPTGSGCSKGV